MFQSLFVILFHVAISTALSLHGNAIPIPTPIHIPPPTPTLIPIIYLPPPTETIIPTSTPTMTPIQQQRPTAIPKKIPTSEPTSTPTSKVNNTPTIHPVESTPKPNPPPNAPLLSAINIYRRDQGKKALSSHEMLCRIAQERVEQINSRGSLDNHEGIQSYTGELLSTFRGWSEVIFSSSPAKDDTGIVQDGWAKSEPHRQSITQDDASFGCGALKNGFAVFLITSAK